MRTCVLNCACASLVFQYSIRIEMPLVVLQEFQLAFTRAKEQTEAREFFFGDIKTQFDEDRARLERFVSGHFLTSLSIMRMSSN